MSGHKANKVNHCLNRLALTGMKDPDKINPNLILREFCDFEELAEMKKLFHDSCQAALSVRYTWKDGSPGRLLYFHEQLEILVEACFLIYHKKGFKKRVLKRSKSAGSKKLIKYPNLPCSLTLEENMNPLVVIKDFFDQSNLLEWKRSLHAWMEAALSNFSVLENINPEDLLPYRVGIEKILEACYRIVSEN
jgi:hypothetical protein